MEFSVAKVERFSFLYMISYLHKETTRKDVSTFIKALRTRQWIMAKELNNMLVYCSDHSMFGRRNLKIKH